MTVQVEFPDSTSRLFALLVGCCLHNSSMPRTYSILVSTLSHDLPANGLLLSLPLQPQEPDDTATSELADLNCASDDRAASSAAAAEALCYHCTRRSSSSLSPSRKDAAGRGIRPQFWRCKRLCDCFSCEGSVWSRSMSSTSCLIGIFARNIYARKHSSTTLC